MKKLLLIILAQIIFITGASAASKALKHSNMDPNIAGNNAASAFITEKAK